MTGTHSIDTSFNVFQDSPGRVERWPTRAGGPPHPSADVEFRQHESHDDAHERFHRHLVDVPRLRCAPLGNRAISRCELLSKRPRPMDPHSEHSQPKRRILRYDSRVARPRSPLLRVLPTVLINTVEAKNWPVTAGLFFCHGAPRGHAPMSGAYAPWSPLTASERTWVQLNAIAVLCRTGSEFRWRPSTTLRSIGNQETRFPSGVSAANAVEGRPDLLSEQWHRLISAIGDDSVDAHLEQSAHVGRVVHRPHVHFNAVPMCQLNEPRGHNSHPGLPLRHLNRDRSGERSAPHAVSPGPRPARNEAHDRTRTRRCGNARQRGGKSPATALGKRRQQDTLGGCRLANGVNNGGNGACHFDVDVQRGVWEPLKGRIEAQKCLTPRRPQLCKLGPAQLSNASPAPIESHQRGIVPQHRHPVSTGMHVRLNVPNAQFERRRERASSVFQRMPCEPTMRENTRGSGPEVGHTATLHVEIRARHGRADRLSE